MKYHVMNVTVNTTTNSTTETEIITSAPIDATKESSSTKEDVFYTTWDWLIPTQGSGLVTYHVRADITCAPRPVAESMENRLASLQSAVLGTTTEKKSGIAAIIDFISKFFTNITRPQVPSMYPTEPVITPVLDSRCALGQVLVPTGEANQGLQLGTFQPVCPGVTPGCQDLWMRMYYESGYP
jgi:hypothetical protein